MDKMKIPIFILHGNMEETSWENYNASSSSVVIHQPVNEWIPHLCCDGARMRIAQFEDAFDDRYLCTGRVESTEWRPIVDDHPASNHIATSVHGASLTNCETFLKTK